MNVICNALVTNGAKTEKSALCKGKNGRVVAALKGRKDQLKQRLQEYWARFHKTDDQLPTKKRHASIVRGMLDRGEEPTKEKVEERERRYREFEERLETCFASV